jgi:2-methylcitrate dehydratase PrpD
VTHYDSPERCIAEHIVNCRFDDISPTAIGVARRSLIDGTASMIAGRRADGIGAMLTLAAQWGGNGEARIFGSRSRAPAPIASWCNGAMMRALELDDCTDTLPLHPTAAILPALLAAADLKSVSGSDFLRALAIAQDLKIRFGLAVRHNAMQSGRGNLYKIFAATAGVAAAFQLDVDTTLHALGIAASYGIGDMQCALDGSLALRTQFGNIAHGALHSVLLARLGVTGPTAFLTGRFGFFNAYEPAHDLDKLLGNLGKKFEGERIAVKPYAACRCSHAAIDLVRTAREQLNPTEVVDIARIDVGVTPEVYGLVGGPLEAKMTPPTAAAAQFSMHFAIATALQRGGMGLRDSEGAALADAKTLALCERVHVTPVATNRTQSAIGLTTMRIMMNNGEVIEQASDRPLGGVENPISAQMLRAKFDDCLSYAEMPVSAAEVDRFFARAEAVEREANVARLFDPFA